MSEPLLLKNATVQESQIELLRRTTFNALYGERVTASLLNHRQLRLAVADGVGASGDEWRLMKVWGIELKPRDA